MPIRLQANGEVGRGIGSEQSHRLPLAGAGRGAGPPAYPSNSHFGSVTHKLFRVPVSQPQQVDENWSK